MKIIETYLNTLEIEGFKTRSDITPGDLEKIKKDLKIKDNEDYLGFFSFNDIGLTPTGIAFTNNGMYWNVKQKIDGKDSDKKNGFLSYNDLAYYSVLFKEEIVSMSLCLIKRKKTYNGSDTIVLKVSKAFAEVFNKIMSYVYESAIPIYPKEEQEQDLYEDYKFRAYIGDVETVDIDTLTFYRKIFAKYEFNGVEKFAFNWSWSGFLVGAFYLIHRKAYLSALLTFIITFVVGILFGDDFILSLFIYSPVLAIITPYLLFKRYKKVRTEIEATNNSNAEKIELYKIKGGTNTITSFVAVIFGLLLIIFVVVNFIRGCFFSV